MNSRPHRPENAEFELRKAYNVVIDGSVPFFWEKRVISGVNPAESAEMYHHAYDCYRRDQKLAAERWARASKHLSRAFASEAKIAYLDSHSADLPFLEGASPEAFNLHEKSDTTADLLNSVAELIPQGPEQLPSAMNRYLSQARIHLEVLNHEDYPHELPRAERIRAAYEYGRVLELMALAYEAEHSTQKKSA